MANFLRSLLARPSLSSSTLSSSPRISLLSLGSLRPFSSSAAAPFQVPLKAAPERKDAPEYPYGYSRWFKKSNRGIYGGTRVRIIKKVSEGYPAQKVRLRWKPNVHRKRLWSGCLGRQVRIRMVLRILRSIDKAGGLDRYLLSQSPGRVRELGPTGWALRWRLLRTEKGRQIWEAERLRLGLPPGQGPRSAEYDEAIASEVERWRQDARRVVDRIPADDAHLDSVEAAEEQLALQREQDIDDMLEREDQLAEDQGGLDLSDGSKGERQR